MTGAGAWSRRGCSQLRRLRTLVRDTQRALSDVANILDTEPDISSTVQQIGSLASGVPALVILGRTPSARVRLVHALLDTTILPDDLPRGIRWIRVQYGSSLQVKLTLGNSDFELLDELHCSKTSWNTLPLQDLLRQNASDLTTLLDIEINNSFLKEGIQLLIPPDLDIEPGDQTIHEIKLLNKELYAKRESILSNFNPIYVYGIDSIGKNIFVEDFLEGSDWSSCTNGNAVVFTPENCLDLLLSKELNPSSQVLFVLFSDSQSLVTIPANVIGSTSNENFGIEATESGEFSTQELPESDQGLVRDEMVSRDAPAQVSLFEEQTNFMMELSDQWKLMCTPSPKKDLTNNWLILDDLEISNSITSHQLSTFITNATKKDKSDEKKKKCKSEVVVNKSDKLIKTRQMFLNKVLKFSTDAVQCYVLDYCGQLTEIHTKLVQQLILSSFDLARELQVVPKKIQYVSSQEQVVYQSIREKFMSGDKKRELVDMMRGILDELRGDTQHMDWSVDELPCHQDSRYQEQVSLGPVPRPSAVEAAESYDSYNFDDFEIINSTDDSISQRPDFPDSSESQISSITVENESDLMSVNSSIVRFGTRLISRSGATVSQSSCQYVSESGTVSQCQNTQLSIKQASLDVQRTVLARLSRKISLKMMQFVDCLKDSYFGTLQRCLESLESSCREELEGRPATEAIRQILSVARQVDLQSCASFPVLRTLMESIRRLFHKLRLIGGGGGAACCVLSPQWRRHVALHTVHSLSASRLARIISDQILERLSCAHSQYQTALGSLESALVSRLHHTEDVKLAIRKKYAPGFARLSLESTSMCDFLKHGMPELGREIGRGQYGVVFAVKGGWGGHPVCAAKSVIPADDRHYAELAMEVFYTRSIPPHPNVVPVFGSVLQSWGSPSRSVLLLAARRRRDLHCALPGLTTEVRMRIAVGTVRGIRYLHSLGLVHRDIKLKNVLLDQQDRAALSDLGFCSAGALLSGSLVGTPVHMAPELLAGNYGYQVDVYAFGVLFWYLCAGTNKLPSAFESFQNKEQLWSKVTRGLRPERLPDFSDSCWSLMEACWRDNPADRPSLGEVHALLHQIRVSSGGEGGEEDGEDSA